VSDPVAARWLARAWTLLAASSALYFLADNEADNDLWVHLFAGRLILTSGSAPRTDHFSYTASGLPWVDHEWLTQAAFAAVYDLGGSTALWLCKLAIALLTAWLLWRSVARRGRSWWLRGPILVLVFATLARGYAIRPQTFTYLGVAALLSWLDHLELDAPRPRAPTVIALMAVGFVLWANLHGGFIFGLAILALYLAVPGSSDNASRTPSRALRAAMLIAATIGACVNPYGPGLFSYIAAELFAPHPLTEWQPVRFGDVSHAPFWALLAAWLATLPFSTALRRQPWRAALIAVVAMMAVRHQRHSPLLALCAAAPLTEQARDALAWLRARTQFRLSRAARVVIAVALAGLALVQLTRLAQDIWLARGGVMYAAGEYPVGAIRFLQARGMTGNLALPLDWGGYALWHTAPGIRVSLDGRFATVYPPAVVDDNFAFFHDEAGASGRRLLEAYDTTLVLVPHGTATALDGQSGWQLLYADAVASLFGKSGTPAAGVKEPADEWLQFP
jgi:hypothetical protein